MQLSLLTQPFSHIQGMVHAILTNIFQLGWFNSTTKQVKRGPMSYGDPIEVVVHSTSGVQWEDPIDAALNGISRVSLGVMILLVEEILHQLGGSLSHYLHGFIYGRWCRISSINSMCVLILLFVAFLLRD